MLIFYFFVAATAVITNLKRIVVTVYAKEHGLLKKPGLRRFKRVARRKTLLIRLVK